jgi:hypothetical protein
LAIFLVAEGRFSETTEDVLRTFWTEDAQPRPAQGGYLANQGNPLKSQITVENKARKNAKR